MPRLLGEAAVAIVPQTLFFRTALDAQIKKALTGAKAEVPVVPTVGRDVLTGKFIQLTAGQKSALKNAVEGQLNSALKDVSADIPIRADFAEFQTTAEYGLKKALQDISRSSKATVQIRPDTTAFRTSAEASLQKALGEISLKTGLVPQSGVLKDLPVQTEKAAAGFTVLRKVLDDFDAEQGKASIATVAFSVALKAMGLDAEKALAAIGGGAGRFRDFGGGAGYAGRGLFGFGFVLRGSIGFVKIWHVVLSAVIETLILFASVAAAATVAALAMSPAIEDLTTNLKAMHTVNESLHQSIGPLTGQIHNLGAAMAPQVVELYGAALGLVGGKMGILQKFGPQVVTVLDDLAAKFTVWFQAQESGGLIVQHGIGYIIQLAHIFGTLGQAINNLIKADPGILRVLLDLLGGFASVLNIVSQLPLPILTVALALHGAWIWGNVLARALLGIATSAKKAALGLYALRTNPLFWVAATAAALGYLAYQSTQADSSTKSFIDNLNAGLAKLSASQAILQIAEDIQLVNNRIALVSKSLDTSRPVVLGTAYTFNNLKEGMSGLKDILYSSDIAGGFRKIWNAISGGQAARAANDVNKLHGELITLNRDQTVLFATTGHVMTKYGQDTAHAFALIDLAGVKAGDSLEIAAAKVDNLVLGYQKLVGNGTVLNNSLNAVTFQALQQQSQIDALTGAWDAFYNTVTGGLKGFLNFAQALLTMNQNMAGNAKAAAQLATAQARVASAQDRLNKLLSSGGPSASAAASATDRLRAAQDHLSVLQKSGHATALQLQSATDRVTAAQDHLNAIQGKAGPTTLAVTAAVDRLRAAQLNLQVVQGKGVASFTGLNQNSITLRQSFLSAADAAQQQLDALLKLSSAAGLGQQGTDLVTRATKDMIQVLLPAAKHSSELTHVLFLLAQQGGVKASDSFDSLSKAVGKTKNPMQDLQKVTDTLTKSADNLSQDVKNLSVALGRTLNDAMALAIFQASGGQKVFSDFADSIKNTGAGSLQSQKDAQKLADSLYGLTGNVKDAHSEFITFATKGLHLTQTEAETLWKTTLPNLQKTVDKLHGTSIPVQVIISGHGTIKSVISGFATQLPTGKLTLQAAAGGAVQGHGSPWSDSVPAMLSPGEYVINSMSARRIGYSTLARMNKLAAGGAVSGAGVLNAIGTAENWSGRRAGLFASQSEKIFARQAVAQFLNDFQGLNNLPLIPGPASGSAAVAQAFARSILWAYGWKMDQWPYELALWNRESGWNAYAQNPTSGAAGIPQNINGWSAYKPGDYQSQIRWGDSYIFGRYGNPQRAWDHEVAFNWYKYGGKVMDRGGILNPGMNLTWNGTGRREHLVPDSGSGHVEMHFHFHGPVGSPAQLQDWLARSIDGLARRGRLAYALRRSPSV